jgi:hypothetical protein
MSQPGTNYSVAVNSTVKSILTDDDGNILFAYGTLPSGTAGYAIGCLFIVTSSGIAYSNTGTATSCSFVKVSST